ncbi:hypothetical protein [Tsukamurella spumae]|uniref:Uncharacterized protein n=1 Tax=Tsukamurella spumae TaxID=44753 RepID=A0A846X4U5_9ACTN|nr:hypothetical protein [Tsukamurella spumae]
MKTKTRKQNIKVPAAEVATVIRTYFVPGVGAIDAIDLEDLERKLRERKEG